MAGKAVIEILLEMNWSGNWEQVVCE